jgi:peroxiredoxin
MNTNGWKRLARDWAFVLTVMVAFYVLADWLRKPSLPDIAPNFDLQAVDGGKVSLSSLRGQAVVLNFWATWCGPCRTEIPELNAFKSDHPDVELLGIAINSGGANKLSPWLKRNEIHYTILVGTDQVQSEYDVSTLPTTVIIDGDGRVREVFVGAVTEDTLTNAINSVQDS